MKIQTLVLLVAFAAREPFPAVLLAAPAGAQGGSRTSDGPCRIPNVIGLSRSAAENRLRAAKLESGRVDVRPADQQPGIVFDQQPRECAAAPADGRVNLVVAGRRTGDSAGEGTKSGTSVGDVAVPVGIAVGAAVIASILARGHNNNETTVPDLVKQPVDSVAAVLRKARLTLGEVSNRESMTVAAGAVTEQSPAAGAHVAPGSPVSVRVSSGRTMTEVPDLVGLSRERADARTTEARLRLLVTDAGAGEAAGLSVVSQVPEPGTRTAIGAAVGVVLRAAQAPVAAPGGPLVTPPPVAAIPVVPQAPPARVPPRSLVPTQATTPPADLLPSASIPAAPPSLAPSLPQPPPVVQQPEISPVASPVRSDPPAVPAPSWLETVFAGRVWPWVLLLLLLLGAAALVRKRRLASLPGPGAPVPPPALRVTFVPRLDAGQQVIMSASGARSRSFGVVCHVDTGRQHLRFDRERPALVQMGARS